MYDLTIRKAGAMLRSGTLSPVELTEAVLARIVATEPILHAYVKVFPEEAMVTAREAELELRAGHDRGPLHGIPIAIKDILDMVGVPTRCGSRVRADASAAEADAEAVGRLRAAGAVIVGKTVTHEFAGGVLSAPTRNPWDPGRIPGGSSGGSGAAVAAGSCLAALGTDTAGSIRIPAALCGVVGLKPTIGWVSTQGVFPLSWSLDTVGPLTKTVDDAMLVLKAIVGDGPETEGRPWSATDAVARENLRGIRLGIPRPYFFDCLQADVAVAIEAAIALLADLGAEVIETSWPEAPVASATGFVIVRPEMAAVHAETLRSVPERYGPVLRARLEAFSLFPARGYLRARQARSVVRRAMSELFAAHSLDALVTPTVVATATVANQMTIALPDGEEPIHAGFTRLTMPFNTTGQPALSIPCGFNSAGLPIGLQLVGVPRGDAELCSIGQVYEKAADWNRRRPVL